MFEILPLLIFTCIGGIISSDKTQQLGNSWYLVEYYGNSDDWLDLRNVSAAIRSEPLSTSPYSFAVRKLNFKFPYYSEQIEQVLATTQGFLYTGQQSRTGQLFETQYISPLMAGFTPTLRQDVRHLSNSTIFINQWSGMALDTQNGYFTFQVQLLCNGVIKLIYKDVPVRVRDIQPSIHVTKVGISDAYTETVGGVRSLIPYDTLTLDADLVVSDSTFILTPIPTCTKYHTCSDCISHSKQCYWCDAFNRCSTKDGNDKYHPLWTSGGCSTSSTRTCSLNNSYNLDPVRENTCLHGHSYTTATDSTTLPNTIPNLPPKIGGRKEVSPSSKAVSTVTIVTVISVTTACVVAVFFMAALILWRYQILPVQKYKAATNFNVLLEQPTDGGDLEKT